MKKIKQLEIQGGHREAGVALGQAAEVAFREIVPTIERYRALERGWLGSDRVAQLEAAARAMYPQYMTELEGMAEGARTDFERVFLWNCRGDLPGGGDQTSGSLGCTSIICPTGLIAHNEDDQFELREECFFASVQIGEGGFHSFYSPGLLPGHTFGVSSFGLVQTINHLRTNDQKVGVPRHLSSRAVFDAPSLDEAIRVLEQTDRAGGFHHNLGMAGDSRLFSVEAPATGFKARQADSVMAHANHLVTPELSHIDQTIAPSSGSRQRRADALTARSPDGVGDARELLLDRDDEDYPIYRKVHGKADPGYTLASAVFSLSGDGVEYEIYSDLEAGPEHQGKVAIR